MYKFSLLLVLLLTFYQNFANVDAFTFPGLVYSQSHVIKRGIEELNCTEIYRLASADNGTVCDDVQSSLEVIGQYFNDTTLANVTDDTYRQLNSAVTEFCISECKDLYVGFFECLNLTQFVFFYNNGLCGRINQEYCMVRYLEGIATNTIQPVTELQNNCPNNSSSLDYCIDGPCQDNVTNFINFMGCCGAPLLVVFFNLESCNITNTDPCPSATIVTKTSLVIASSSKQARSTLYYYYLLLYIYTATADYSQNNVRTAAIPSVIPLTNTVPVVATPMCQGI